MHCQTLKSVKKISTHAPLVIRCYFAQLLSLAEPVAFSRVVVNVNVAMNQTCCCCCYCVKSERICQALK